MEGFIKKLAVVAVALLLTLMVAGCGGGSGDSPPDEVLYLPDYGKPNTRQFAGLADATPDGANKLFYYFIESDVGSTSVETPTLIWLNGGPGASSMMGLFVENLGPQKITKAGKLVANDNHITKKYHLMAVDNPVGAGFSHTATGAYVKSEEEMRTQFVYALRQFFDKHPEYKQNPLWVTGESYAGKYVPNIGLELAVNATEIPFQGIVVGNGMYNETAQYPSIGEMAFGAGVIDEVTLANEKNREKQCLAAIESNRVKAGDFCENITVRWLYTGPKAAAGSFFYYDFGMADASELDVITDSIGRYLNTPEVKKALHVPADITWVNADEEGPVAEAIASDFTRPSAPVIAALLEKGKRVTLYNGVRDGSVCNHIGNLRALLALQWSGAGSFAAAINVPWPSIDNVMGHIRSAGNLRYATVLRTGHLVPTVVPESYAILLDMVIRTSNSSSSLSPDEAVLV